MWDLGKPQTLAREAILCPSLLTPVGWTTSLTNQLNQPTQPTNPTNSTNISCGPMHFSHIVAKAGDKKASEYHMQATALFGDQGQNCIAATCYTYGIRWLRVNMAILARPLLLKWGCWLSFHCGSIVWRICSVTPQQCAAGPRPDIWL